MFKPSISIVKDSDPPEDNAKQLAKLDDQIVAAIETQRLPSGLTLKRYRAAVAKDHQVKLSAVRDTKAALGDELVTRFVHLMALTGEPVVIDADRKADFLNDLRAKVAAHKQTPKGDE